MKHICIITTRHISYNPRVLKEADALHAVGYKVTVVTVNYQLNPGRFDEQLMSTRQWTLKTVNFRKEIKQERLRWIKLSVKQKIASFLAKFIVKHGVLERAMTKAYDQLLDLAVKTKADLYIVHHPEALGIGYKAAQINKTRFGFDAEDFHTGMNKSPLSPPDEEMHIEYLEKKYLSSCSYVTAASKGIAEAYKAKYNISLPTVVLNAFPIVQLPKPRRAEAVVKFYWYSQVIGPNRNLEYLMKAASGIPSNFEIHLRGDFHSIDYKLGLESLIKDLNLESKVFFHEPILAEEIITDATNYDVGLALELKDFMNSNLCVSNKTFAYLMAGLAIIGNDTVGQKDIFANFSNAAVLCDLDDTSTLTEAMLYFINTPGSLKEAKMAARQAALNEFNWEKESEKFITCVKAQLDERHPVAKTPQYH